jgi:hypothetical protein
MGEAATGTDAGTSCPVCGDPLDQRTLVKCRSCDTLHHRECWLYAGVCSTYGCAQRRCDIWSHESAAT